MTWVSVFLPAVSLLLFLSSAFAVSCLALAVLRARQLPAYETMLALVCSGLAYWMVPQQQNVWTAGFLLWGSGFSAFAAAAFGLAALREATALQAARTNPVVVLCGRAGSGKSLMLERYSETYPGVLQLLAPRALQATFDPAQVHWDTHQAVALDELCMWERSSIRAALPALERTAIAHGKQLVLVVQHRDDLAYLGYTPQKPPVVIELVFGGQLRFSVAGREVRQRNIIRRLQPQRA